MKAIIERLQKSKKQTLGIFTLYDEGQEVYKCHTLELPWLENKKRISCIPDGTYQIVPRTSPKFALHYHITNVPNRDYILIHAGNYYTQILGCILVGDGLSDINNDGEQDVLNSKKTLNKILNLAPNGFELDIL